MQKFLSSINNNKEKQQRIKHCFVCNLLRFKIKKSDQSMTITKEGSAASQPFIFSDNRIVVGSDDRPIVLSNKFSKIKNL